MGARSGKLRHPPYRPAARGSRDSERKLSSKDWRAGIYTELDPVERWFQEFRRDLSNKAFETVELLQVALTLTITPYWEDSAREGSAVSPVDGSSRCVMTSITPTGLRVS